MNAADLAALDGKLLWHPYASTRTPYPANIVRSASGTRIRLDDGTELVDAVSSWWCACHGHNHPRIVEAVRRQSEKFTQVMFAGFTHEPAVRLAELLTSELPEGLTRVFFSDSGSVSVECALKMALQYQYARGERGRVRFGTVLNGCRRREDYVDNRIFLEINLPGYGFITQIAVHLSFNESLSGN